MDRHRGELLFVLMGEPLGTSQGSNMFLRRYDQRGVDAKRRRSRARRRNSPWYRLSFRRRPNSKGLRIVTANNQPAYTAEEALSRLKDGNARFVSGHAQFPTVQKEVLAELAKGQQPYATVLGCSDSRVPPELVFDAGFGELFVVRVAGNVLGPSIVGTLQYARAYLHTPLFIVLGHESCGAVKAAIASRFHGARHQSRIALLLENIVPALDSLDRTLPPATLLNAAVEANVRWTVREVLESPEGRVRVAEGDVKLVGAVYELASGHVRFLE
jgi:carbonic anhydrase